MLVGRHRPNIRNPIYLSTFVAPFNDLIELVALAVVGKQLLLMQSACGLSRLGLERGFHNGPNKTPIY